MKNVSLVIVTLLINFFAKAQDIKNVDTEKNNTQKQAPSYTCPMHPEIHSPKPGNCPKCGMPLVKEKTKAVAKSKKQAPSVTYTCPMHPEIHSPRPGNCPKCGMPLVKEKIKSQKEDADKEEAEKNEHMHHDIDSSKIQAEDSMQMDHTKMDSMQMKQKNNTSMDAHHDMPGTQMNRKGMARFTTIPESFTINNDAPKVIHYDLYIQDTIVTYGGKRKRAIAANGQIPMPTLTFTEGDTAEIVVHNELEEGTTLHWHGLFLDNQYDGVSYLTQKPIPPHTIYTYRFPIRQSGTHWYHSHFGLQEQLGMYGSMILLSRKELNVPTIPVVISEWTNVKPEEIHRRLYAASDWFAIQKGSTQNYAQAIATGHFKTKVKNEWKRMNAMDVSDIYYNQFLVNGENQKIYNQFKSGDKVRLRIANAGASSYFWLQYAGGKITVIASDGNDVKPVMVDRLIIGTSETYDVLVTIPENKQYEFLITPEDRTRHTSVWLGSGEKVSATKMQRPKYFAGMKMMNSMIDMKGNLIQMEGMKMQNQQMDMNVVMYPEITGSDDKKSSVMDDNHNMINHQQDTVTGKEEMNMQAEETSDTYDPLMDMNSGNSGIVTLNYNMLRATEKTTLPAGNLRTLNFELTGNMNRYVWTLDNKTVSESDRILIRKGENLRLIIYNNSMMRHPMHLHGHDFRILNAQGEYAPLKNVLDIMPMEKDTIEFAASENGGDWFFHCHILYHMMSGMGRIFSYENGTINPQVTDSAHFRKMLNRDDNRFHLMANVGVQTNGSDGNLMLSNTRFQFNSMWHLGYHDMHGYESETMFGRYFGKMQWLFPYIGFDYHYKMEGGPKNLFGNESKTLFGQNSNKLNRKTVTLGVAYTLPMLFVLDSRIDGNGQFRMQLSREDIPVTSRLRMSMMINSDKEYMAGFSYVTNKYLSLAAHYDSDMGWGAGLIFTY